MPDSSNSMGKQQCVVSESESIPPNISTWVMGVELFGRFPIA